MGPKWGFRKRCMCSSEWSPNHGMNIEVSMHVLVVHKAKHTMFSLVIRRSNHPFLFQFNWLNSKLWIIRSFTIIYFSNWIVIIYSRILFRIRHKIYNLPCKSWTRIYNHLVFRMVPIRKTTCHVYNNKISLCIILIADLRQFFCGIRRQKRLINWTTLVSRLINIPFENNNQVIVNMKCQQSKQICPWSHTSRYVHRVSRSMKRS